MMTCERCRQLLLDYAYGLLEAAEADELERHLETCDRCRAARRESQRWQQLLAAAARDHFPHVRFEPPVSEPLPTPRRTVPVPAAAAARWLSWSVAAAIWLTGPLILLTVHDRRHQLQSAQQEWFLRQEEVQTLEQQWQQNQRQRDEQLAEARRQVAAAEQLALGLLERWLADSQRLAQAASEPVDVLGPLRLQPGAPNDLLLVLRDHTAANSGRLLAEIRDQNDAVLYSRRLDPERGGDRQWLHLPARLWTSVTSQSELFLVLLREDERTRQRIPLQEKIRLSGPLYVTYLTTDRVRYRPGDTLYFRSLTLDRVNFRPPPREQWLVYTLRDRYGHAVASVAPQTGTTTLVCLDPNGVPSPVMGPDGQPLRGVGCGALILPPDLPEGDYVLEAAELDHPAGYGAHSVLPARCAIRVARGPQEQLAKQLHFLAASFMPGSWVEARAEAKLQNCPASRISVEAQAWADGRRLPVVEMLPHGHTDEQGCVYLRFRLPDESELSRGDVRLQVVFRTSEGSSESIVRAVPVAGKQVVVEFFPEGGQLVAGVPCRVYVRAATPAGTPVDIRGVITDGRRELARVETQRDPRTPGVNRGLASFTFTPELGRYFWLKLEEPQGVSSPLLPMIWQRQGSPALAALTGTTAAMANLRGYLLPTPQIEGVVLTVQQSVVQVGEPLRVRLYAVGKPQRRLVVGAYIRGQLVDIQTVTVTSEQWHELRLLNDPQQTLGGVVRLTVYEDLSQEDPEKDLQPLAERLVFRQGGQLLQLQAHLEGSPALGAAGSATVPTELTVTAKDERGQPVPAVLYAAVVNSANAPLPSHRLLTTHFLIAGEIQTPDDLEYADFLLTSHPEAAASLDLLLGTQGWRRFHPLPRSRKPLPPAMPATAPPNVQLVSLATQRDERRWRLYQQYWPRYEQAVQQWEQARRQLATLENDPAQLTFLQQLQQQLLKQHSALKQVSDRWHTAVETWQPWRQNGIALLSTVAVVLLACLAAAWRRWGPRLAWGLSAAGLVLFLTVGVPLFMSVDAVLQAAPLAERGQSAVASVPLPKAELSAKATGATSTGGQSAHTAMPSTSPANSASDRTAQSFDRHDTSMTGRSGEVGFNALLSSGANDRANLPGSSLPERGAETQSTQKLRTVPLASEYASRRSAMERQMEELTRGQHRAMGAAPLGAAAGFGASAPLVQHDRANKQFKQVLDAPADRGSVANNPGAEGSASAAPFPPAAVATAASPVMAPSQSALQGGTNDARSSHLDHEIVARRLREMSERQERFQKETLQAKEYAQRTTNQRLQLLQQGWNKKAELISSTLPKPNGQPAAENDAGFEHSDLGRSWLQRAYLQLLQTMEFQPPPLIVREYAPVLQSPSEEPDTILWKPVIVLPTDGTARLPLQLGAAPGGYDLLIAGHSLDGRLGALRTHLIVPGRSNQRKAPDIMPVPNLPTTPKTR